MHTIFRGDMIRVKNSICQVTECVQSGKARGQRTYMFNYKNIPSQLNGSVRFTGDENVEG